MVARGIAPGIRTVPDRLAEGHIHHGRQGIVNMAFSHEPALLSCVPGALPQATMTVGLQPTPSASMVCYFETCDSGRDAPPSLAIFEAAPFRSILLAEGHIHGSLGHRPGNSDRTRSFGRRPYSPWTAGHLNMAFSHEPALLSCVPGASPQATMTVGLQPTPSASMVCNFETCDSGRDAPPSLAFFEAAPFRSILLAEGHIHGSPGHRPGNSDRTRSFDRRPYSPWTAGHCEYGFQP
jgi:hypothetical protein